MRPGKSSLIVAALLVTVSSPISAQTAAQIGGNPPPAPAAEKSPKDMPAGPEIAGGRTPGDPLEKFNRKLFKISAGIDKVVFRPLAFGAGKAVSKPVRKGFRNFFRNLTEPLNFANGLLQLRPKRSFHSFKRFLINSVAGLGGVFDVAKSEGLEYKYNGFGNTLARWGVGPGPYLFLPFVGPTTLRDLFGTTVDANVLPVAVGKPFDTFAYQAVRTVSGAINTRIENDEAFTALIAGAADPYATFRSVYLQNRAAEIRELKGTDAEDAGGSGLLDTPLDDPAAEPGIPPADGAAPGSDAPVSDIPAPDASGAPAPESPPTDPAEPQVSEDQPYDLAGSC